MQRSTLVGLKVGLLAVLVLVALLGMSVNAPVTQWLQSAFHGLAFAFAFGFGAPEVLAYVLAGIAFLIVFWAGFLMGKRAARKLDD